MNLKNESKLGDIYIFIYRTISFYRQLLKIACKLCTPVRLEVRGLYHGTLLPLTLKTSLNTSLVNIFNSTRVTCRSSLANLWYLSLKFQISISILEDNIIFCNCNDLGKLFWILHSKIERSTGISTRCLYWLSAASLKKDSKQ